MYSYFFGSFEVKTYCNLEFLRVRLLPVNQSKFAHINSNEINEGKKNNKGRRGSLLNVRPPMRDFEGIIFLNVIKNIFVLSVLLVWFIHRSLLQQQIVLPQRINRPDTMEPII